MDSAAARPDEEEARRRRSTDCIYFLASPLTCKKGSECEYRHSDAARMNPRDCWYWFHGNCANPKCSFRHPPLDNMAGAPTTPRPAQQSVPHQASASVPAQPQGSVPATAKQGVPCYYFQKGMCTKGDRCAFLHAPRSAGNPAPQPPAKVFTTPALQPNLHPPLNNSWTKPNLSAPAVAVVDKPKASTHHDGKPLHHKENLTSRTENPSRVVYQNHSSSYAQPGAPKRYQPQPSARDGLTDNGMEAGEFAREPSAGSCVTAGFNGAGGMTRQTHGGYEPERSYRNSAERSSSEKRIPQREHIPSVAAGSSDLRHRLLKQRKSNNNSRSAEALGRHDTHLEDDRNDQHRPRGEQQDGLSRSRLHDRIRLPGETAFDSLGSRSEEWDRGSRARLSPPKSSDLRGRLHERLKGRLGEEIPGSSAKGLAVKASSSEDTESLNFAGPKSLAELKAKKGVGRSGEDAVVKGLGSSRMTSEIVWSREAASFEGPKPLSAILKRKREPASEIPAAQPGITQEADNYAAGAEEEIQTLANDTVGENMEGIGEEEEEEEAFHPEDDVAYDDNANEAAVAQELDEYEDADAAAQDYDDEAAAAQEVEEHQDGEAAAEDYDYEEADVNAEEENEYQDYQDEDDDDLEDGDDDFARKVSVMIS